MSLVATSRKVRGDSFGDKMPALTPMLRSVSWCLVIWASNPSLSPLRENNSKPSFPKSPILDRTCLPLARGDRGALSEGADAWNLRRGGGICAGKPRGHLRRGAAARERGMGVCVWCGKRRREGKRRVDVEVVRADIGDFAVRQITATMLLYLLYTTILQYRGYTIDIITL